MGRELVLGAAIGYERQQVTPFLVSLRRSGYSGDVVLLVDSELRRSLRGSVLVRGVELRETKAAVPFARGWLERRHLMRLVWRPAQWVLWAALRSCSVLPARSGLRERLLSSIAVALHTPMEARFLLFLEEVRMHACDLVLVTDVRDVIFQSNPFKALPATGLSVSIESDRYTVGTEAHNAAWIERCYGASMLRRLAACRVSCVGVTFGDGISMERYLSLMVTEILKLSPRRAGIGGADTAVHNVLLRTGLLGEVHEHAVLESPIGTMNDVDEAVLLETEHGAVLNPDGTEISILHQYDRLPRLREGLLDALTA